METKTKDKKTIVKKVGSHSASNGVKADIYTQTGKKKGSAELPESIFGVEWNADLVHQVVVGMQANARTSIAHTKDRSEVAGGGKKPWKQKGTGRARHGSSRSPIWKGGGVTFGPRNEVVHSKKINKKMRVKALFMTLAKKLADTELIFMDSLKFEVPKSAEAKSMIDVLAKVKGLEAMATKSHNAVLIALSEKDVNIQKSFSNFGNIYVSEVRNLNPVDVLKYKYVIIVNPEQALEHLEARIK